MKIIRYAAIGGLAALLGACSMMQKSDQTASAGSSATPSAAASKPAAAPEALYVYFDKDSQKLNGDADKVLDQAARLYREGHPSVMLVTGHADKTGKELPSLLLSAKRAAVVKQGLADRGLPQNALRIAANGWTDPVAGDQKDTANPKDRVAVITWH